MGSAEIADLRKLKDDGFECYSFFCVSYTCLKNVSTLKEWPCAGGSGKYLCCKFDKPFPFLSCKRSECFAEAASKCCCFVSESQWPPSVEDIGFGCCSIKFVG